MGYLQDIDIGVEYIINSLLEIFPRPMLNGYNDASIEERGLEIVADTTCSTDKDLSLDLAFIYFFSCFCFFLPSNIWFEPHI